jgi:para-nitrobenzyl esterase
LNQWGRFDLSEMTESEDCLCLTVHTPRRWQENNRVLPADSLLPVFVHIHGGSYNSGSGETSINDLDELAAQENIVTVTVSYRLGVFGFAYRPDIGCANLGLRDQMNALRWVSQHISEFGGNPKRITLSGQSAGAQSVVYLLAQMEEPLIRYATVWSAPMGMTRSKSEGKRYWREMTRRYLKGLDPQTCSADTLRKAQTAYEKKQLVGIMLFAPTNLEQMPKRLKVLPDKVLVCTQKDDGSVFGPRWLNGFITHHVFTNTSRRYARYLHKQGVDAQFIEFDWIPRGSPNGATHCCELMLFAGHPDNWLRTNLTGYELTEEEFIVQRRDFMKRLGHFVRTGEWK